MKVTKQFNHQDIRGFKNGQSLYGKPNLFSHFYLIDGLLIDTGHRRMQKDILRQVKEQAVEQIFISHYHEDHTGNLNEIQNHFACPAYASAACVELMKDPPAISFAQKMSWGDRPSSTKIQVKEGQIKTAKYTFDLIPIPGHAPDMFALHEPNQAWLFSADLWVYDYIKYFLKNESMMQQIESLKRVLPLDFDVLLCGHNPIFKAVKKRIQNKIDFLETFYGRVADLHRKGMPEKEIMKAMHLKEKYFMQIISGGDLSTINMLRAVIRDEAMG